MKKLTLILLVLVASSVCVFAAMAKLDFAEATTPAEKFAAEKLSIVDAKQFSVLGGGVVNGWKAYCGPNLLTKSQFFEKAGYPDLAAQLKAIEKKNNMLLLGGCGSLFVGTIVFAVGTSASTNLSPNDYKSYAEYSDAVSSKATGGLVGLLVGAAGFYTCLAFMQSLDISPDFALNVASGYNNSLAVSLDYQLN